MVDINYVPKSEEVFDKAYVDKATCRVVIVWPVPEDLTNWYETDFDPEFEYFGKVYDPITGEWKTDAEVQLNVKRAARKEAYIRESDPLYLEYQFDKTPESEKAWRDSVQRVKDRIPL